MDREFHRRLKLVATFIAVMAEPRFSTAPVSACVSATAASRQG
jgi:hypothetical protein